MMKREGKEAGKARKTVMKLMEMWNFGGTGSGRELECHARVDQVTHCAHVDQSNPLQVR